VAALLKHPLLRPTTIAGALRNLGNAATGTVALVFAYRVLGLSPGRVGLLLTVSGVASILGAWLSAPMLSRLGTSRTLIISCASGVVWTAAPLMLWLPATPVYVTVAAMSAFWLPVWNTTIITFRQTVTAPELLGRVHATSRAINFCALPLGALIGGTGADVLSSVFGATSGLSISLVVVGLLAGSGAVVLVCSPAASVPAGGEVLGGDCAHRQQRQCDRQKSADWHE
jgi:predicted MFS family arabinose efflux permease